MKEIEEEFEEITLEGDILKHVNATSNNLDEMNIGSKERDVESQIYQRQFDAALKLQREQFEQALELERFEAEKAKNKTEKVQGWARIGLRVVEVGAFVGMGWLKLKENMLQGSESGKDAENWFQQLLKK